MLITIHLHLISSTQGSQGLHKGLNFNRMLGHSDQHDSASTWKGHQLLLPHIPVLLASLLWPHLYKHMLEKCSWLWETSAPAVRRSISSVLWPLYCFQVLHHSPSEVSLNEIDDSSSRSIATSWALAWVQLISNHATAESCSWCG